MKALIVGAGFSGLVSAVSLAEAGYEVRIVEKRDHIGGNAYDAISSKGVRYHPYGPHIFHTNDDGIFEFLSRFTKWVPYIHRVKGVVGDDTLVDFPININTLRAIFPSRCLETENDCKNLLSKLGSKSWAYGMDDKNMEIVFRQMVGDKLFETFYKGYSEKQWGKPATELPAPIAKRIPIRFNDDDTYFNDKYQCLPMNGYTEMFENMARYANAEVTLEHYRDPISVLAATSDYDLVVYTGPIDELFGYEHGHLEYRSLKFEYVERDDPGKIVVKNYPSPSVPYTREAEYGLLPNSGTVSRSCLMREFPSDVGEPYYPMLTEINKLRYKQYAEKAEKFDNLMLLGRLAEYKYYDMHQAVGSALAKMKRRLHDGC